MVYRNISGVSQYQMSDVDFITSGVGREDDEVRRHPVDGERHPCHGSLIFTKRRMYSWETKNPIQVKFCLSHMIYRDGAKELEL